MAAQVSLVVPIYNVHRYLSDCLESIAAQTHAELEVVMVDDGSTDASADVAQDFADRDSRFRLVRQSNRGLGAARNAGARLAQGEHLMFVDSDDVLAKHALELLVSALGETESDFACGNVKKLTNAGTSQSRLHARAFSSTAMCTHIRERPALFNDTTAWNKLFRRSFWDKHGFEFPEGVYYEDIPVTIPAHFLASTVDVLADTVYFWRERPSHDLSITQRRTELKNFRDRMAALSSVDAFLREHCGPGERAMHDAKVLDIDLPLYINVMDEADEAYCTEVVKQANAYLDHVDSELIGNRRAIERLKYHLLRRELVAELVQVVSFQKTAMTGAPIIKQGRHWYGDYPFRRQRDLKVPRSVFRLDHELDLRARVDDVRWEHRTLVIEGRAFINLLDIPRSRDIRTRVYLRDVETRERRRLRVDKVHRPDVTATSRQTLYSYDWAGFRARVPLRTLLRQGGGRKYELLIEVRSRGVTRSRALGLPMPGRAQRPPYRTAGELRVKPFYNPSHGMTIRVERPAAMATSVSFSGNELQLAVEVTGRLRGGAALRLARRGGVDELVALPVSAAEGSVVGSIPLPGLLEAIEVADEASHVETLGEGLLWDAYVRRSFNGRWLRVALHDEVRQTRTTIRGREFIARRTWPGNLTIAECRFRPEVDAVRWDDPGTVVLEGLLCAPPGPWTASFHGGPQGIVLESPLQRDGERFTVAFDLTRASTLAGELPLPSGRWSLSGRPVDGDPVTVKIRADRLDVLPTTSVVGGRHLTMTHHKYDGIALVARPDWRQSERGMFAQDRLVKQRYPASQRARLSGAVLFESWHGKQYSDNPRALHEELRRQGDDRPHLWVSRDDQVAVPGDATPVRMWSEEYVDALATSSLIISNDLLPPFFDKRPGQRYLQTWHGTPLKRIGFDMEQVRFATRNYLDVLARDVRAWDHLVSPNPFSTQVLPRAMGFEGPVLEVGYPRNDVFHSADREARSRATRQRLGLPADKVVVLYAPTWRDANVVARGEYAFTAPLDVERLEADLGKSHVVLLRGHHLTTGLPRSASGFVRDASAYPDIQDLYLVADVLVTDYSSVMFDFANTGRPQVFFAYDLEEYRDTLRGFYLDFESIAPGPVVKTQEALTEALRQLGDGGGDGRYDRRYADFRAAYCGLEDGSAAARVIREARLLD